MAHQAGKISNKSERNKMYKWLEKLEFGLLELPHADIRIFLHMPYEAALTLKTNRPEALDEHERSKDHLVKAEAAYLELTSKYSFYTIECVHDDKIRSVDDISEELFQYVREQL